MASRFWVLDTGTWDASDTTHWSATSGGLGGQSVPGPADTVTFDANSFLANGTCTVNTNFNITSFSWGTSTGTIDFSVNNNSPTMTSFNGSGTSTRSMKLGSGTFTITGNASANQWQMGTVTGLTWNAGTSTINFTYSGSVGTRTISPGTALVYYNMSFSAGTDIVSIGNSSTYNNLSFAGFAGTTNAFTSTFTILGNVTFGTGMTIPSGTGTFIFAGTLGTQILTSNGVQFNHPITVNNPGATMQLFDALDMTGTSARTLTLTAGGLDTNGKTVTVDIFAGSNSNVRTLSFVGSTINIVGSAATIWNLSTSTSLAFNASGSTINFTYSGATGTRTIGFGVLTYNVVNISAGTDIISATGNGVVFGGNFSFVGFTGTNSAFPTASVMGNWTLGTGMTCTSVSNALSFTATSGTQIYTSNGVQMNRPVTINAPGATVQLADALDMSGASVRTLTVTAGIFNSTNNNIACGTFFSSNSNTRSVLLGTSVLTLTGNNTNIFSISTVTGLTFSAANATIRCTYSGSTGIRSMVFNNSFPTTIGQILVTAGTDTFQFSSPSVTTIGNFDMTGFSGILGAPTATYLISGNLTFGTGMTVTSGAQSFNMTGTSGIQTITSNGVQLNKPFVVNAPGATVRFADNFDMSGASPQSLTLTAGTLDANNKNITAGTFVSSNTNTRTLTMGSGTWTLTGSGIVWNTSTNTNLTFNAGTSTIVMNDASASSKTLADGGLTFNNLTLSGTGTGVFVLGSGTGTMTFNVITVSNAPHTVQFFAGVTTVFTTLVWSGTAGNLNTFQSTVSGSPWYLVKSSGTISEDYISLQDSYAGGGALFYAGNHSIDAGDNSGWIFTGVSPASQNASRDENRVTTLLAVSNADGHTLDRVYADTTSHYLYVDDNTTGDNLGPTNAPRDENRVTALLAVSSADGVTPVVVYMDSATGKILVNSN